MTIDQHTKLYGVVGHPIGHSLSPTMHNAAFRATGVNAVYLAFDTMDIEGCIKGIKALGIRGMSVTIPHKSAVIPLLDELDALAEQIGAVNTIVNNHGFLTGYNTDAVGALRALEEKVELEGKTCVIIGAGGAARAIGFILKNHGVRLSISNRSVESGENLARYLDCSFVPLAEIENVSMDILIHSTPVGMYPHDEQCLIPREILRKEMVVMDIIYNPLESTLLKRARSQGCLTIDGLGMFIHQGAEQFRLWTGLEAPVEIMRGEVEQALRVGT